MQQTTYRPDRNSRSSIHYKSMLIMLIIQMVIQIIIFSITRSLRLMRVTGVFLSNNIAPKTALFVRSCS